VIQDLDLLKAFGPRLRVGFSIPTDDDTVRQIVEPDAPPIPSRWAVLERLSRAGVQVGVAAAPLMPVHDLAAFVRRAKASGASTAWVGSLRLLPKDPFYRLLAEHDWLRILDEDYVGSVRTAFLEAFPKARRASRAPERNTGHALIPVSRVHQPTLFEAAGA
jgi:DNA repair photolyase